LWAFYVNRGQGICGFGVEDKDHAMMQFYPANQAYQEVCFKGFRTFLKIGDRVFEPFSDFSGHLAQERMIIEPNILCRCFSIPGSSRIFWVSAKTRRTS
jgi:hypothetical protein